MKLSEIEKEQGALSAVRGHKVMDWTVVEIRGVERECPVVHVDGIPLVLHPDQLTHTVDGLEVPDQQEMDIPLEFEKPVPLHVQMQQMIRSELSRAAASQGFESFEEANDFDVDDIEEPPVTDHELAAAEMPDEELNPVEDPAPKPAAQPPASGKEGENEKDEPKEPKGSDNVQK